MTLVAVVEEFDGLFQANGDKEADGNGRDVDKEIFPCVRGSMGRVHVKHEYGVLLNGK